MNKYSHIFFNDLHFQIIDQIKKFNEKEVEPNGLQWENDGYVPNEIIKKLGHLGYLGIRYPKKFGGLELDLMTSVVFQEALSRNTFAGFTIGALVHTDMASPHLMHAGNPSQIEKYMPGIVSGDCLTAVAISEPNMGSDVAAIQTKAEKVNNGFVINGTKIYITNGVRADLYFVAVKTGDADSKHRGLSIFLVPKNTPGFNVVSSLDKHGWRSSDTAELSFCDCFIPFENMLGEENHGFYSIMENFQIERIALTSMAIGQCQIAIEITLDWLKLRKTFGNTLWSNSSIRQKMAKHIAKLHSLRAFLYETVLKIDKGQKCVSEVSMLKALSGEISFELLNDCVQFHGGLGYMTNTPIERIYRDVRILSIGGGATEIMLEEVAKRN